MANLHTALKALAPITFSDLPTEQPALDSWLSDLFSQTQLILESVPIPPPNEHAAGLKSSGFTATKAAEVLSSTARSSPPTAAHQSFQQEWGKPVKLGVKEDMMGMSVYKLSGKDGRGSWFARRSVHEGLSFDKFKKALEKEFPESTAVQGAPGEGNVRGIGGETKVEDIKTAGGRVEVYRLSAQFPGPTTPRDFVTMLISNEHAMTPAEPGQYVPRHYMIVSKPCNHPETQPQGGFIRGFYESVEFIREVPRLSKVNQSTLTLNQETGEGVHNFSRKRTMTPPLTDDSDGPLPVEWIMVTRSDPGGSVPRFMVERGTPSSICADATKFLDWACQQEFNNTQAVELDSTVMPRDSWSRESRQSFRNSRLIGADEIDIPHDQASDDASRYEVEPAEKEAAAEQPDSSGVMGAVSNAAHYLTTQAPKIVTDFTPQAVLDHLPGGLPGALPGAFAATPTQSAEDLTPVQPVYTKSAPAPLTKRTNPIEFDEPVSPVEPVSPMEPHETAEYEDDRESMISFESADSHVMTHTRSRSATDNTGSRSDGSSRPTSSKANTISLADDWNGAKAKELRDLQKLEQRRALMRNKFSESRAKLEEEVSAQSQRQEQALQRAAEKREKELQKQKEKFERGLRKIEEKQSRERRKMELKERQIADRDDKVRLTRERNEARLEGELVRKEVGVLKIAMDELRKNNAKAMDDLQRSHDKATEDMQRGHSKASEDMQREHGRVLSETRREHAKLMEDTRTNHAKMMEEMRRENVKMMEDMRKDFTKQIEDLRKENTKLTSKLEKAIAKAKKKSSRDSGSSSMLSLHRKTASNEQKGFVVPDSPPASISS